MIAGDDLLAKNFPMIHAVGRASAEAPRLIDMRWGRQDAPKVTLVGKGVCFDTGGLDIKPSSGMLLMKKDMGGAANVLGLASMIMAARLKVRLRVLIPVVENAISGNAFRPGDVLTSRKGLTVEIGNTDAEGRLILADALALADEEEPELLIDMATLTGAARVALGPDLPPFYTDDDGLAADLAEAAVDRRTIRSGACRSGSPTTRSSSSKIADLNNVAIGRLCRLDHRGAVPQALRREERRAGRISTSSAGARPTGRTARPAARRRRSARLERVHFAALRPDKLTAVWFRLRSAAPAARVIGRS